MYPASRYSILVPISLLSDEYEGEHLIKLVASVMSYEEYLARIRYLPGFIICILDPETVKSPSEVLYAVLLNGTKKSEPLLVLDIPEVPLIFISHV
jgi:hypothetical protein